jgi:hypothetical protein
MSSDQKLSVLPNKIKSERNIPWYLGIWYMSNVLQKRSSLSFCKLSYMQWKGPYFQEVSGTENASTFSKVLKH